MDFTQIEKSTSGIENVLVFTDVFTKYTITIPTRDQTAKTVSRLFVREWIKKPGVPERIHSNQSRSFENQIIKQLCLLYQVRKSKMTPYHPRRNSQVKRFNRSMKEEKWTDHLQELVFVCNCTPHSTTSYTPYYLFFGHDARLPVDNIVYSPGDRSISPNEWIQLHHYRMQEAVKRANNRIKLKAAE